MNDSSEIKKNMSTRDRVLSLLESADGGFLSGEQISAELGISRTAVWKAVRSLRNGGYSIEGITKLGYRLLPDRDILSSSAIRRYMSESMAATHTERNENDSAKNNSTSAFDIDSMTVDVFATVDSTNTVCMKRASEGFAGTYIAIAGEQTGGKGRRGRSFFSPADTGLYMSILLRPAEMTADRAMRFTTIAAVAASEAIETVSGLDASIKWVNDVYAGGRKVSGILTEASFNPEDGTLDYAVVGIGINVYEPPGGFPAEIRDRAGSLAGAIAGKTDAPGDSYSNSAILENGGRNRLAAELLARFFRYCNEIIEDSNKASLTAVPSYMSEYRKRCFVIGQEVDVIKAGSKPVAAHVMGLDDECHLIVRYKNGKSETLGSGEISIREQSM